MEQGVDPMKANIDWKEFRERQRQPAEDTVQEHAACSTRSRGASRSRRPTRISSRRSRSSRSARAGRPAAVRARLEKEDGLDRVRSGIRREKTMTWLLEKATMYELGRWASGTGH